MKIEVTQAFYGRPDETVEESTLFLEGAVVDVPDDFAKMVIEKALAQAAGASKAPSPAKEAKPNETE